MDKNINIITPNLKLYSSTYTFKFIKMFLSKTIISKDFKECRIPDDEIHLWIRKRNTYS